MTRKVEAMVKVHSAQNVVDAMFWREQLQQAGIACEVRNQFLSGAAGELPPTECWPEIWVNDPRDEQRAKSIIEKALSAPTEPGPAWRCPNCDETVDAGFEVCWNCGTECPSSSE